MSVRPALCVVAFIFGLVVLVIVVIFGAFVALAYRNRRFGFSYFVSGMTTPKVSDENDRGF